MEAKLRSWWQQIKRPLSVIGVIAASILVIALVIEIIGGYLFNWKGTGVGQKTLWDWMQLLFIPVVLAVAGFWFNHRERKATELRADNERKAVELRAAAEREIEQQRAKAEQEIMSDNQREVALQAYIDKISELLLKEHLGELLPDGKADQKYRQQQNGKFIDELKPEYEAVRKIARVRTLTILPRLDGDRKSSVLQFLHESGLITMDDKGKSIIDLDDADFQEVSLWAPNLSNANLKKTNLRGAILNLANLSNVKLSNAQLVQANLSGANLRNSDLIDTLLHFANLRGADLNNTEFSGASLYDADLQGAIGLFEGQLEAQAKSLKGATMPDGSIYE